MVDKVTVEVVRHGLIYAAEEMGVVLRNTAFSPNIRDRLDYSCAILNAEGELVAQAEHIPVHLGSMPVAVKSVVEYLDRENVDVEPGDVFITNDPYIAGTHLNDILVMKPVFINGVLAGFVANKAHHVDIGGVVPGSIGGPARTLVEEGLVVPPVKLYSRGRLRRDVLEMLRANVRTPRFLVGDLKAQVAALRVGEKRLRELAGKYGLRTLLESWDEILGYAENYARNKLRSLVERYGAEGVYEAEDYLELAGGGLARIRASLHVRGNGILVDFTGSSRQVDEPLNAVYGVTVAATTFALKAVVDPEMPMNSGFYRVVRIHAPKGTIVNPVKPAPVSGGNVETSQRIVDVVLLALSKAFPDLVPAAGCGSMTNLALGGRGWAFYETVACGSGGRPYCDGVDGVHVNMTNTLNTPIELIESEYPIRFVKYELRPDSGGPGRYRGGLGITRAFTVLEDNVVLTVYAERCRLKPWGLAGGKPGAPARHYVVRADGSTVEVGCKSTILLNRGDTVYINTPGGGGYGDPCSRSREAVEKDLREGKITLEHAKREYCYTTLDHS